MVKCAECGYLALRHLETRDLREAEGDYRDTGEIPRDLNRPKHLYEEVPLCFERLHIFTPQECASAASRYEVLQREIGPCVGFTKWDHGFTPKEHREMADREKLRTWQAEQEAKHVRERRVDALILALIAGGFTTFGVALAALLR